MPDEAVPLGDDRYEQRVAVDRRRLEAMITGKECAGEAVPNAESFFDEIMFLSGAKIFWPAQLKIGAKTKRGTKEEISRATRLIAEKLQIKKERVTLKMEIHHSLHSNMIGKGGRGIQEIMRRTHCHIHFPDSNKFCGTQVKSDQVSISGAPEFVHIARNYMRDISPFNITFELPWFGVGQPVLSISNDLISWQQVSPSSYRCLIRGSFENEVAMIENFSFVLQQFNLSPDFPVMVRTTLPVRNDVYRMLKSPFCMERFLDMACDLGFQSQGGDGIAIVTGPIGGVLSARKMITVTQEFQGLSPVSLYFDTPPGCDESLLNVDNNNSRITVTYKKRMSQGLVSTHINSLEPLFQTVFLKGPEETLEEMLTIRALLFSQCVDLDPGLMMDLSSQVCQSPFDFSSSSLDMLKMTEKVPKSPDPEDSPLAASILKGVKEIDRNAGCWKKKNDRERMLLKAAQVVYDDLPMGLPRYPTDHWAGYGLSSSLPADLLKGLLSPSEPEQGRLIEGRSAKTPPRSGLCAVREEDELSDFSDSLSSRSNRSRYAIAFDAPQRSVFSASTSIFDAAPVLGDFSWDIRQFSDPAMVLTQLGCSEYLALMREQEIDMHAFLLLDEQNLKDIGVSTIGARKKIHHAILKLRESARLQGYSI